MSRPPLTKEAIEYGTERITDFSKIHITDSHDEREGAASVLLKGLGLTTDLQVQLDEWMDDFGWARGDIRSRGGFYIGVIVGMLISEYMYE